jgi:hypothetical protein
MLSDNVYDLKDALIESEIVVFSFVFFYSFYKLLKQVITYIYIYTYIRLKIKPNSVRIRF